MKKKKRAKPTLFKPPDKSFGVIITNYELRITNWSVGASPLVEKRLDSYLDLGIFQVLPLLGGSNLNPQSLLKQPTALFTNSWRERYQLSVISD